MARTYTGRRGRVYGVITGTVALIPGVVLSTIVIVRGNLVSKQLQQTLVDLAPWLSTTAGPEVATEGTVVGLLFGGFMMIYGVYHLARVVLVDDYSITVGGGGGH